MNVHNYLYLLLLLIPAYAGATSAPATIKVDNRQVKVAEEKKKQAAKQAELEKENIQPSDTIGGSPAVMNMLYFQLADLYTKQAHSAEDEEEKKKLLNQALMFYEKATLSELPSIKDTALFAMGRIYIKQAVAAQTNEARQKAQWKAINFYEKARLSELPDIKNSALIASLDVYLNGEEGVRNDRKAFLVAGELESNSTSTSGKWLGRMRLAQMGCLGQGLENYNRKTSLFALLLTAEQNFSMRARLLARAYTAALKSLDKVEGLTIEDDFHLEVLDSKESPLEARTLAELVSHYKEAVTTLELDKFRTALTSMHVLVAQRVTVPVKLLGKLLILQADKIGSDRIVAQQMREMAVAGEEERDIMCGVSYEVQTRYINEIIAEKSIHYLHKLGLAMKAALSKLN